MLVEDMPILWRLVPRLKEDEDAVLNVNDIMDAFRAVMMINMPRLLWFVWRIPMSQIINRIGMLVQ
jgi:hypothetical protein